MSYQYYREITIDHTKVPGDLTDFPFLFNTTDADLKTVANGGKIENTASNGGASGSLTVPADLVFSPNQDGSNPYDFEVEKYDPATGELVAHVRIPSMSSSEDTVFYLIYGDSDVTTSQENVTGVWDTNFKMVHHMYDNAGGNVSDSTSNSNDGTKKAAGEPVETSSGRIGKAQDFDGSDDHIDVDSLAADVKTLQAWTIECSIKPENLADGGMLLSMRESDEGARPRINLDTVSGNDIAYEAVGESPDEFYVQASDVLTSLTWYHIVLVADGTATTIYLDASSVASGAGNRAPGDITNAFAKYRIGERVYPGSNFPGIIDEYRVSSVARSTDYITATYNNQSSPSTFHSLGSRQFVSPSFTYCKKITIDHTKVPGDLTDFPILFNTTDADLKTVANGGKIENTASNGGASGSLTVPADLVFSPNLDGSDPYDFEVEKYDPATGELIAHVRIPSLSSSVDTVFYLVYGDSGVTTSQENVAGTWDSNFKAVWHFGETSGTYHDSTANNNDSTAESVTSRSRSKIGNCPEFGGADTITIAENGTLDLASNLTIECWVYPDRNNTGEKWCGKRGAASGGYGLGHHLQKLRFTTFYVKDYDTVADYITSVGTWYHVVAVLDTSFDCSYYVDGTFKEKVTHTTGATLNDEPFRIGQAGSGVIYFDGRLDEVRISNTVRSADYITATYNNQSSPSTFYTLVDVTITLVLQPDEANSNDAFLLNANPTTNFGSHGNLWVGERAGFSQIAHSLLKFDLTDLPAGALIVSAKLSLWLVTTAEASQGDTIKVYRLKRDWVESQATWNIYSTGNSWQVAGGDGADDREQTEIGSADTTGSDPAGQFFDIPLTPTSKTDLDLGYGWLLRTVNQNDDLYIFYSSAVATPSQRPKLTIVYTVEAVAQPYSFIM